MFHTFDFGKIGHSPANCASSTTTRHGNSRRCIRTKQNDYICREANISRIANPIRKRKEHEAEENVEFSSEDPSTKLLGICKKNEWTAVKTMLRETSGKKLDFTLADENGYTALLLAAREGRINAIEMMLELGADINVTTNDKMSIAHVAALFGKEDIIEFLISKKVDFSTTAGVNLQLPLHYASSRQSVYALSVVKILLQTLEISRLADDKNGAIPLFYAVESNNLDVADELLILIGDAQVMKQRTDTQDTVLHLACRAGNMAMVKLLIRYGVSVNVQNSQGWTALHEVAMIGDENLLKVMHQLQADATIVNNDDKTPLHLAAEHGHTSVVETLVDKLKGSLTTRTKDGSTLLHIAAFNGYSQMTLNFLKLGVPMHMPNKNGAVALHCAASMGHIEVVKTLLNKGTPVDIPTKNGYTALHVAIQAGKSKVVEILLGNGANVTNTGGPLNETALHIAAKLDTDSAHYCAEMLLKSGAEANVPQKSGETPLHIAARCGRPDMIRLLLSEDADPLAISMNGETALHVATRSCQLETSRLLIEHVQKRDGDAHVKKLINLKNAEGLTALHFVAEIKPEQLHKPHEDAFLATFLINYGGDVNIQSSLTGETMIHYCAKSGNKSVLLAIIDKIGPGAVQIVQNKQSKTGWFPLLVACDRGNIEAVKLLLEQHARIDVFDEFGRTGLHLAAANGYLDLTDLLLRNKAFINCKTKAGEAPLHLAAMNGHNEVVNLLVNVHMASLEAKTLDNSTSLHFATKHGQLAVSSTFLQMGANPNARDIRGRTPLHLAAEVDRDIGKDQQYMGRLMIYWPFGE